MAYDHILAAVFDTPWAILPSKGRAVYELLQLRAGGGYVPDEEIQAIVAAAQRPVTAGGAGVAVIPVHGVISQRMNLMSAMSGGTSTEQLTAAIRQAVGDPAVGAIVLDVDSPGGSVFGIPELGDIITQAKTQKPIIAVANSMAASAAYWLASQADELVVTPSGEVGSIGVIAGHLDQSAANEMAGLRVSYVTAGKYKGEFNEDTPLAPEARAYLQSRVNDYYGMFTAAVAKGRGVATSDVRSGFGEGRMVGARDAVRMGMADRVGTLDDTIARLQGRRGQRSVAATVEPTLLTVDSGAVFTPVSYSAGTVSGATMVGLAYSGEQRSPERGTAPPLPSQHQQHSSEAPTSGASSLAEAGDSRTAETEKGAQRMAIAGNRLAELQQQRADLIQQGSEAVEGAARAGRDFSPEEIAAAERRTAELSYLNKQIAVHEAQREAERSAASNGAYLPTVHVGGPTLGGASPGVRDKPWGYDYGVRMVAGADGVMQFGGIRGAQEVALGDFLQAVAGAFRPGGQVDPRLFRAAASGGNTSVPSDGGFAVGTDFTTSLMQTAMYATQIANRCTMIDISANSDGLEAPMLDETSRVAGSRWGGVRIYRRGEADTVTATKPTLRGFELRLEDLMGLAYVTDRLLADAAALGQVYRDAFTSEFAYKLDEEILRGTGVGECLGILSADNASLISASAETGQTADTVVAENVINMMARMWPRSRNRAAWFVNIAAEPQLQQMTLGTGASGQLVYMPAGGLSGAPFGTLYGLPVIPIEQASALGDVGDIILADFSEYVLIRKGGVQFDESMHVRFIYGENTFRWTQRVNGKPKWRTTLTPAYGTNTLSPFVTLAAR